MESFFTTKMLSAIPSRHTYYFCQSFGYGFPLGIAP